MRCDITSNSLSPDHCRYKHSYYRYKSAVTDDDDHHDHHHCTKIQFWIQKLRNL